MADGDEKPPRHLTVADLEQSKKAPLDERRKLLSTFREQFGIALTELGKVAEVPQPILSQFERGERDLSAEA
jgi:Helix-turn-helix